MPRVRATILPRKFYARNAPDVARELLGKLLGHGKTAGIVTEVEAYPGGEDLASHSSAGITPRTRVIFGPPGHAYVYFSYGMHVCMNVVTNPAGEPGCVLIRALQPVLGIEEMRARRKAARLDRDLTNGPGKLTQALGIELAHYGADLTRGELTIRDTGLRPRRITVTARIGITKCADLPLRFVMM